MTVHSWEEKDVEARWVKYAPAGGMDDVHVSFAKSGKKIFLHSYLYASTVEGVKMELRVPSKMNLEIRGIQPAVTVDGVKGSVNVATLRGRISILTTKME